VGDDIADPKQVPRLHQAQDPKEVGSRPHQVES